MYGYKYLHRIWGRDMAILATMKRYSVKKSMTHYKGFKGLNVEVIYPID